MPTIFVPLDGTPHSTVALPVARTLAKLLGGTIHLLHIAARRLPHDALLEDLGLSRKDLRGTVLEMATGSPAEAIVRAAGDAKDAIIVLCMHTGLEKAYGDLGHVTWEVLCAAPVPIFLVQPERGHRPWVIDMVLLPHDGTPTTAAGFAPSVDLTLRAGAELIVLYVAEPGSEQPEEPGTLTVPRYVDQPHHEWPAWASEFLNRTRYVGELPHGLRLRLQLVSGDPGTEIVRYAREHGTDLIIIAWHGHPEPKRAETLKSVVQRAPCPVAVYRVPEDSGG
jgi:nucleotide-binding universal stress UspA family protein